MPKRHSDVPETGILRPTKRARVTSDPTTGKLKITTPSDGRDLQDLNRARHLSATISPALLSSVGDDQAKASQGIRRRMNAESLAVRLGPELVKELEALLKPGMTEMPSFAVRQEIQQRYGIDRRHIYDWFHNRGLRVATIEQREERRAAKAKAEGTISEKRLFRTARSPGVGPSTLSEPSDSTPSTPSIATPLVPYPLDLHGHQLADAVSSGCKLDGSHEYSAWLGFQGGAAFDTPSAPIAAPAGFSLPLELTEGDWLPVPAERLSSWIAEQRAMPYDDMAPDALPTLRSPEHGLEISTNADDKIVLPQDEREAFYQSLHDTLPPAHGIEESVGTYKAFMTQQMQSYYDRLTCSGRQLPPIERAPTTSVVPKDTAVSSLTVSSNSVNNVLESPPTEAMTHPINAPIEVNGWLFYGAHPHRGCTAPSPASTPAMSEASTATSSVYWNPESSATATTATVSGTSFFRQCRYREASAGSGVHLDELLESPHLGSRNSTSATARTMAMPAGVQLHPLSPRRAQDVVQAQGRDAPQIPFPHGYLPFPAVYHGHPPLIRGPTAEFVHEYPYIPMPVPLSVAMAADCEKGAVEQAHRKSQSQSHNHHIRPTSTPTPPVPQTPAPTIFIAETGSGNEPFTGGLARSKSMSAAVDNGTAHAQGNKGRGRGAGKPKRTSTSASAGASTSTRASQRAAARAAK